MSSIKCDICGYKFRTFQKVEVRYRDYEPCEEVVSYPDPKDRNPPHLLKNYVCDRCYKDIGNVIKKRLVSDGRKYTKGLTFRVQKEKELLEEKIKVLENENNVIEDICTRLENIDHLYELTPEEICVIKKYEYKPFHTYYLDEAIYLDIENNKDIRTIANWLDIFEVPVLRLPGNRKFADMVDIKEFRFIIENSVLRNFNYQDIQKLLIRIDKYNKK